MRLLHPLLWFGLLVPLVASAEPIKLVLQVTVDGLRGDLLERYQDNFGQGGFRYLLDNGVVYTNAQYQHANTETIVGHTTLATGTTPSRHGMIGNAWLDRESGELGYNIEDPAAPPLPSRAEIVAGAQVDPAQAAARSKGRSPRAILAPTLADTLVAWYGPQAKAFGVSGKDRSAVAMAGHVGKAFWTSTDTGDFITSAYYYDDYPRWARDWNEERKAANYAGKQWELLLPRDKYRPGVVDERPYERDLKGYGISFPHPFGEADHPLFATRLLVSPVGDRLAMDFSKTLIKAEGLGDDDIPDYLSVSFSGVDAVNHFFGPSSLENQDVVLQLDRTLAELLTFVDKKVGLEHTVVVLSADHGMADMPEYISELGHDVGRFYSDQVLDLINESGKRLFGIEQVAQKFFRPYAYLNRDAIDATQFTVDEVAAGLAAAVEAHPAIGLAVTSHDFSAAANDEAVNRIANNYHPRRSGDIYIAPTPYWYVFEKGAIAVMHGSPWRYDTHVPIIFSAPGLVPATVAREVHPADVAPTLAAMLGMSAPAAASGKVLQEALQDFSW